MVKFNKYNLVLTIKRLIGIATAMILGYLAFNFCIKLIFYLMYLGVTIVNNFFSWIL